MKIVLARHGETDWNRNGRLMGRRDVSLNEYGREQARKLRQELLGMNFDCCFSSSLTRARETAEIVCGDKCEIICDDNLMERYAGEMEGRIVENWDELKNDDTAETDAEILARAKEFFDKLKQKNYDSVLVVSHNGLLRNLRHCILGKDEKVDYSENGFSNCGFEVYEI